MKVPGFSSRTFWSPSRPFGHRALKFGLPRAKAMIIGQSVYGHKANVVAVARVFLSGISQADKQLHFWPRGF